MSRVIEDGLRSIMFNIDSEVFKNRKVLVTGGAGFLGSWLCHTFIKLGASVVCLDNLSIGRVGNVQDLLGHEAFSFIKEDVARWSFSGTFDFIIHGASLPSPEDYVRRPIETMLPNSLGLLNLLEGVRKSNSTLLFTSTSEVYGDAKVVPTPEEYWGYVNPIGSRSCYDESKRFGEALCMAYLKQYGVDVRIARIFNTYGPRMDPEARYARVVSKFIIQALKGEPLTIYGDGMQTRSFCYVTDTAVALLKLLIVNEARGEAVNIGSPYEINIVGLAEMVKKLVGRPLATVYLPPRPDDPRRRCPEISKARRILGWEPKVPLEDGLRLTIEWFRKVV